MASPNNRTIQSENKDTGYFSLSGPRTLTVSAAFRHSPIVPAEVTRGDASDPSDPTFAYVSQTIPAFETFRSLDTEALPSQSLPPASAKAFGLSLEGEPVDLAEATEGEWTACSVPSAGEPPSAPCYLERATCFITGVLPTILMTLVCSALTKHPKCRFSKTEEYQVAGEATQNHNALQFNIAVYRDAPGKQLVEVQRLYGDRFSFNDFFHNLCDELDNVVLHRFSVRLPRSPQLSLDLQFVHSAVDRLASMILAQERDVAREGAKGLLLLTAEAQAQIELDTVIEAIKAGSASDDWEVNRCIATILSAISAHPQHRSSVMVNHECFAAMHALFSGQQESHAFETKMEVCRALLNLAETFGRKLLAQSAVKDILEAGCNEKDSYVRETLNRVRVCVGLA